MVVSFVGNKGNRKNKIGVNSKKNNGLIVSSTVVCTAFLHYCWFARVSDKNVTSKNNAICVVVVFKIVENIRRDQKQFGTKLLAFFSSFNTLIVMAISWECGCELVCIRNGWNRSKCAGGFSENHSTPWPIAAADTLDVLGNSG